MESIPALAVILSIFVGILLLVRLRCPLYAALLAGAWALEICARHTPAEIIANTGAALQSAQLWLLVVITAFIIEFGKIVSTSSNAEALMSAVKKWGGKHGRATSLMSIPAVIGMIPMPGGALFSAPLVGQTAPEDHWKAEWKTVVNYWFRHIWEYWWPLYPVTVVTLSIFNIPIWMYIAVQFPFTIAAVTVGYLCLVHPHLNSLQSADRTNEDTENRPVRIMLSIGTILLSALILPAMLQFLPFEESTNKLLGILIGLLAGLCILPYKGRFMERFRIWKTVATRKNITVLGSLAGVLIFKSHLESSGLLPVASSELINSGTPLILIIILLPFVAGLVTGIAIGFAGTAFPLVLGLIEQSNGNLMVLSTLVVAFAAGYSGMMLSPVHLCFLLTRDYFKAGFHLSYRLLWPCVAVIFITGLTLHIILRAMGL